MSQPLPSDEINFDRNVKLEVFLKPPDDSDTGFVVENDLVCQDNTKEKTKLFPFAPENKKSIVII